MPRLLFEKTGRAVWISHLDLMRLFQRAFKRAGLKLKHTQGFNPRPSVSIALPMSVGVQSHCELLDFDLEGEIPDNETVKDRLNQSLINGVQVLQVYDSGAKLRDLCYLNCNIDLEYDKGVPEGACNRIDGFLNENSIIVAKKTKSGIVDQNISEMILEHTVSEVSKREIRITATICCQNPTLNPAQIVLAVETFLPELAPDLASCRRLEIYDINESVFR